MSGFFRTDFQSKTPCRPCRCVAFCLRFGLEVFSRILRQRYLQETGLAFRFTLMADFALYCRSWSFEWTISGFLYVYLANDANHRNYCGKNLRVFHFDRHRISIGTSCWRAMGEHLYGWEISWRLSKEDAYCCHFYGCFSGTASADRCCIGRMDLPRMANCH